MTWPHFACKHKTVRRPLVSIGSKRGFTLIEAVIALGIFSMITVFSLGLLTLASNVYTRIVIETELMENARMGIESILAHVRIAESVTLNADPVTGTLEEFIATVKLGSTLHDYKFTYNKKLTHDQPRYHRIDFGGNELASYINDIKMEIKDKIIYIEITTDNNIGTGFEVKPLLLKASCDIRYKEVK